MESILTLNQSVFGTKSRERRISKRALKASVQELYVPQESDESTYDDGYDIDGGWLSFNMSYDNSVAMIIALVGNGALAGLKAGWSLYQATKITASLTAAIKGMGESIALVFMCHPIAAIIGACIVGLVVSNAETFAAGLVESLKRKNTVTFEWHIWGFKYH